MYYRKFDKRRSHSNAWERERAIAILPKNTAVRYKDSLINIVDPHRHADFGNECVRIVKKS
ncbi:MAG: hypothetical protein SW833_18955 [Cyanobacteriota bacterium]|nr:hypothetical protein [Cyanobacteriota bacterium]